ncbi:MAG: RNA 2',3'-cyclic phosphodiesterase [Candidatus Omnitrophota bacterium]
MRAFISINLTDSLHEAIGRFQKQLDPEAPGVRWIRPQNCHLTLKFLGEMAESQVEIIERSLLPIAHSFRPFSFEMGGAGQFPKQGPLSVLWVGIRKGSEIIASLENAIRAALEEAKISFDKKPFSPHLTIGRGKNTGRPSRIDYRKYENVSLGVMEADAFYLMESVLDPQGAIYTPRGRFPLGEKED